MSSRSDKYRTSDDLSLSEQVRAWRVQCGMTQSDLESRAGLSHNAVSRIERDEVSPRIETVERLAGALNISVEELTFRRPTSLKEDQEVYCTNSLEQLVSRLNGMSPSKRDKLIDVMLKLVDLSKSE